MSTGVEIGIVAVIEVFLLVSGIQLWRGKWLNLIAGYNTMSREEKSKVNGRFVGRVVGTALLFCAALVIVTVIFPKSAMVCAVLIGISVVVVLVLANSRKSMK